MGPHTVVMAMRKTGLWLAAGAIVCWLVVGLPIVTADGAAIGAGVFIVFGVVLSILASVPLVGSVRSGSRRIVVGVLAAVSVCVQVAAVVLGSTDSVSGALLRPALALGVAAFIVAVALGAPSVARNR